MRDLFKIVAGFWSALFVFFSASCTHHKTLVEMEFDPGIRALADELAGQLEKAGLATALNRVEVNPLTRQGTLKKLVVEPFIDGSTGYPVILNSLISSIMTVEMMKHVPTVGPVDNGNIEVLEYAVTGLVSLEERSSGPKIYKINAAVFDKATGVVHASAEALIKGLDTYRTRTPVEAPRKQ